MSLFIWHYELEASNVLNQKSHRKNVSGFLIRYNDGYGCVQAWEEFGHENLQEHLSALKNNKDTALTKIAKQCATIDGTARRENRSWWHGLQVPASHATLTHAEQAAVAYEAGFRTWKIKTHIDDSALIALLEKYHDVTFRLDFNSVPSQKEFYDWIKNLTEEKRNRIEFIEDPFPLQQESWEIIEREFSVRLAADAVIHECFMNVWKPSWHEKAPKNDYIITSAMDHPVGQAWAAYQAGIHQVKKACGLRSDRLFQPNDFSESLGNWCPIWQPIQGTGMGFDSLLEQLPWKKI